jgi:hypothetical protein
MIPDRIEYLLMLARDERAENDSLIDRQNEIFTARALRLLQLQELHAETGRILQEEMKRFARWMPKDQRFPTATMETARQATQAMSAAAMPRVVQQGPAPQVNPLAVSTQSSIQSDARVAQQGPAPQVNPLLNMREK